VQTLQKPQVDRHICNDERRNDDVTTRRPDPELREIEMLVSTVTGDEVVRGTLLGKKSSRRRTHNHPRERMAAIGERCSACRWMEVFILYDTTAEQYVVVTKGESQVVHEQTRGHVERTTSPLWVIECLQLPDRRSGGTYLPYTSRQAVLAAARFDADLADAYAARTGVVG
jgi:hypothetical protein